MKTPRHVLLWGAILLAVALLFLLPIGIPYSVKTQGKILPAREWVITKGADGHLMTVLLDHARGVVANYALSSFERADALQFALREALVTGIAVNAFDTVGYAYSSETEQQLIRLKGELAATQAALALHRSGEKEAIIEEARQQLAHARTQEGEFRRTLQRQSALYKNGLISQDAHDAMQAQANLYAIASAIAQARLQAVQSGAKAEQIDLLESRLQALQKESAVLQQRAARLIFISPVSGVVRRIFSGDTLLVVADTSSYVVLMPVPAGEGLYLAPAQPVRLRSREIRALPETKLARVEAAAILLHGRSVLLATAELRSSASRIVPGLIIHCIIQCGAVSPAEYLNRKSRTLLAYAF